MSESEQGVDTNEDRYTVIPRVVVFVFSEPKADGSTDVLLLKGAPTKRLWANRYNGLGGHVESYEDVYSAARREIREEAGLDAHDLRLCGIVNIDIGRQTGIGLFVFTARAEERQIQPSVEGIPEWVPLDRIHDYNLVKDVPILLDRIAGMAEDDPPFSARYAYNEREELHIVFAERI